MTDLMNFSNEEKYNSVYLTEQINLFRNEEGNKAIILHKSLLTKIEKEFSEEIVEQNILPSSYLAKNGKNEKCYELNFEQSLQLLMSESKLVRKGVIEALKKQKQPIKTFEIPKTYSAALMLAAKQAEKIELQETQIKELEPKADFYDAVTDSKDAIDMANAAKVLDMGMGRNKLFHKLRDLKILMQNNKPYQTYIDRGYFRLVETKFEKPDGSTHINIKTLVHQKGLDYIRKSLNK